MYQNFSTEVLARVQEVVCMLGVKMKAAVKVKEKLDELRAAKRIKYVHIALYCLCVHDASFNVLMMRDCSTDGNNGSEFLR